jgi:hypothetical protein
MLSVAEYTPVAKMLKIARKTSQKLEGIIEGEDAFCKPQ